MQRLIVKIVHRRPRLEGRKKGPYNYIQSKVTDIVNANANANANTQGTDSPCQFNHPASLQICAHTVAVEGNAHTLSLMINPPQSLVPIPSHLAA